MREFTALSFAVRGANRWHFQTFDAAVDHCKDLVRSVRGKPYNIHITDSSLRMTVARFKSSDK